MFECFFTSNQLIDSGGACRVDGQVEHEEQREVEEVAQHAMVEEDDLEEEELSCTRAVKDDLQLGRHGHGEEEEKHTMADRVKFLI